MNNFSYFLAREREKTIVRDHEAESRPAERLVAAKREARRWKAVAVGAVSVSILVELAAISAVRAKGAEPPVPPPEKPAVCAADIWMVTE